MQTSSCRCSDDAISATTPWFSAWKTNGPQCWTTDGSSAGTEYATCNACGNDGSRRASYDTRWRYDGWNACRDGRSYGRTPALTLGQCTNVPQSSDDTSLCTEHGRLGATSAAANASAAHTTNDGSSSSAKWHHDERSCWRCTPRIYS